MGTCTSAPRRDGTYTDTLREPKLSTGPPSVCYADPQVNSQGLGKQQSRRSSLLEPSATSVSDTALTPSDTKNLSVDPEALYSHNVSSNTLILGSRKHHDTTTTTTSSTTGAPQGGINSSIYSCASSPKSDRQHSHKNKSPSKVAKNIVASRDKVPECQDWSAHTVAKPLGATPEMASQPSQGSLSKERHDGQLPYRSKRSINVSIHHSDAKLPGSSRETLDASNCRPRGRSALKLKPPSSTPPPSCCYSPLCVECCCKRSHALCSRNTRLPVAPPVMWLSLSMPPSPVQHRDTEKKYRSIAFLRFTAVIASYCCIKPPQVNVQRRRWNAERQRKRAALYFAEQLLLESYALLLARPVQDQFNDAALPVFPSDADVGGPTPWTATEQGGIDGPSMTPLWGRGMLHSYDSSSSRQQKLRVSYDLEPLCGGLLWKRTLNPGRGWRRPGERSTVTLRYAFFSSATPPNATDMEAFLSTSDRWDTITLWLLAPATRGSACFPKKREEEDCFRRAVGNAFGLDAFSLADEIPALLQTLVNSMCIAAKTMTQGELCTVLSPWFSLVLPPSRNTPLFVLRLDAWAFVSPLHNEDTTQAPSVLVLHTYRRTLTSVAGTLSNPADNCHSRKAKTILLDARPYQGSRVSIEALVQPGPPSLAEATGRTRPSGSSKRVDFVVGSGCVPETIEQALHFFTTGSSGCVWMPATLAKDTPFLDLWRRVDGSLAAEWMGAEQPHVITLHLTLTRVAPLMDSGADNMITEALRPAPLHFPLAQYVTAAKTLSEHDREFHRAAAAALGDTDRLSSARRHVLCDVLSRAVDVTQTAKVIADRLDRETVWERPLVLWPYSPVGEKCEDSDDHLALLYALYPPDSLGVWKVHPLYARYWCQRVAYSQCTQHEFLLSPYCSPLIAMVNDVWICAPLLPADTAMALRNIDSCLSTISPALHLPLAPQPWVSIIESLFYATNCFLKPLRSSLPYLAGGVMRRVLDTTMMPSALQALELINISTNGPPDCFDLPSSSLALWPFAVTEDGHSAGAPFCAPRKVLDDRLKSILTTTSLTGSLRVGLENRPEALCWSPYKRVIEYRTDLSQFHFDSTTTAFDALRSTLISVLESIGMTAKPADHPNADTAAPLSPLVTKRTAPGIISSGFPTALFCLDDGLCYNIRVDQCLSTLLFVPSSPPSQPCLWPVPCSTFLRGLRHHLAPFPPSRDIHCTSADAYAACFLQRWPLLSVFPFTTMVIPVLHEICSDLQYHAASFFSIPLSNALLYLVHEAERHQASRFLHLCAPFAAVVLLAQGARVLHRLLAFAHLASDDRLVSALRHHLLQHLQHNIDNDSFITIVALCVALGQQPPSGKPIRDARLLVSWASRLPPEQMAQYIVGCNDVQSYSGIPLVCSNQLRSITVLQLALIRGSLLHALLNPGSTEGDVKDWGAQPLNPYILEPFLHALWAAGCCAASLEQPILRWLAAVRSSNTYIPTYHGLSLSWSLVRVDPNRQISVAILTRFCILLVILAFRTIMAFDPWSGFALNGYIVGEGHRHFCRQCDSNNNLVRPDQSVLSDWLDLCAWMFPVLAVLHHFLLPPDGPAVASRTSPLIRVSSNVRAMLWIANGLLRLHAFGDLLVFETSLRHVVDKSSCISPCLILYSSFSLVMLKYLKGEGQEESASARRYARLFRRTHAVCPFTPFHIGLPDQCPEELACSSAGYRAYSVAYERHHSVTPLTPQLVHDACPARLILYVLGLSPTPPLVHHDAVRQPTQQRTPPALPTWWQRAEILLWNITIKLAPDLFLWFETLLVRPLLAEFSNETVPDSTKIRSVTFSRQTLKRRGLPSTSGTDPETRHSNDDDGDWTAASVLTLGNNAIAGALGVGRPRYLRHDEALYEIAPEFREQNAALLAQGTDIWCAGNPVAVDIDDPPIAAATGEHHTVLLTTTRRRVLCWGCNKYGQCGPSYVTENNTEQQLTNHSPSRWSTGLLSQSLVSKVSCSTALSRLSDRISTWLQGEPTLSTPLSTSRGKTPLQHYQNSSPPKQSCPSLPYFSSSDHYDTDNRLDTAIFVPREVSFPPGLQNDHDVLVDVLAGATYSIARTKSGRLWLWGNSQDGCLGRSSNESPELLDGEATAKFLLNSLPKTMHQRADTALKTPVHEYLVSRLHAIRHCSCGMLHVAAVDQFGGLWLWGQSEAGQLGFPSGFFSPNCTSSSLHPQAVFFPHRLRLFVCKLSHGGDLFTMPPVASKEATARKTMLILWHRAKQRLQQLLAQFQLDYIAYPDILRGNHIGCRLLSKKNLLLVTITDHALLAWSRLDLEHIISSNPLCSAEIQFSLVSCGEGHTIATGSLPGSTVSPPWLFAWGQSGYGQLGLGHHTPSSRDAQLAVSAQTLLTDDTGTPVFLPELNAKVTPCLVSWKKNLKTDPSSAAVPLIQSLRSGGCTNALVLADGRALVWGSNDFGSLGFDESQLREICSPRLLTGVPTGFGGIRDVVFAMGGTRTFVVSTSGSVVCFGQDNGGASGARIGKTGVLRLLSDHRLWRPPNVNFIEFPSALRVRLVAAGAAHTVLLPCVPELPKITRQFSPRLLSSTLVYEDCFAEEDHGSIQLPLSIPVDQSCKLPRQAKIGSSPIVPEDTVQGLKEKSSVKRVRERSVPTACTSPEVQSADISTIPRSAHRRRSSPLLTQHLSAFGQALLNGVSLGVEALGQAFQDSASTPPSEQHALKRSVTMSESSLRCRSCVGASHPTGFKLRPSPSLPSPASSRQTSYRPSNSAQLPLRTHTTMPLQRTPPLTQPFNPTRSASSSWQSPQPSAAVTRDVCPSLSSRCAAHVSVYPPSPSVATDHPLWRAPVVVGSHPSNTTRHRHNISTSQAWQTFWLNRSPVEQQQRHQQFYALPTALSPDPPFPPAF